MRRRRQLPSDAFYAGMKAIEALYEAAYQRKDSAALAVYEPMLSPMRRNWAKHRSAELTAERNIRVTAKVTLPKNRKVATR